MGLKINVMMLTCWEKAATQTYYCGPNHIDYGQRGITTSNRVKYADISFIRFSLKRGI